MEHRIKRDWHGWRQHLKDGKFLGYNAYLASHKPHGAEGGAAEKFSTHQAPAAYQPTSREEEGFHPNQQGMGLFAVSAVESSTLQRSNSVAY